MATVIIAYAFFLCFVAYLAFNEKKRKAKLHQRLRDMEIAISTLYCLSLISPYQPKDKYKEVFARIEERSYQITPTDDI
jgi:hypothetical protein